MAEECVNLGARPKPPFLMSKSWVMDLTLDVDDAEIEIGAGACEDFRLRDRVGEGVGGALEFSALLR